MYRTKTLIGISLVLYILSCADYSLLENTDPPPAASLSVSGVKDSTVTIHWSLCTDENFASYRIYYDTTDVVDKSSVFVDSLLFVGDTVKSIGNLKPATQYYVRVFTRNIQGRENGSNTIVTVTQLAFRAEQKAGDTGVVLSWSQLRNVSFDGFRVFYDTTDNVDTSDRQLNAGNLVAASDTSLVISQVPLGQNWRFKVFAMTGDSVVTSTSGIQNVAGWWFNLYAPDMLSDTTVMLRWSRPRASAGVSEFRIFGAADVLVDTADTIVAKIAATDTLKLLYNMASRGFKYFRVFARNTNSYIGSSQPVAYSALAPSKLTVGEVRDTTITIRWTRCSDWNFNRYKIYYDTSAIVGSGSMVVDSADMAQDTSRVVRGLKPASLYYFRVATLNTGNKIAWSNIGSGCTQIRFKPGMTTVVGDSVTSVFWTPLKGVSSLSYKIFRDTANTVDTADDMAKSLQPSDSILSVMKLPLGKTQRFRIFARSDTSVIVTTTAVLSVEGRWFDQYAPAMQADSSIMLKWPRQPSLVKSFSIFSAQSGTIDTSSTLVVENLVDTMKILPAIVKGSTVYYRIFAKSDTGYVGSSPVKKYTAQ